MWNYVGIVRTEKRLLLAQKRIEAIADEIEKHYKEFFVTSTMVELRNIVLVSLMIIRNCLKRQESRGLHYLVEYPQKSDLFKRWLVFQRKRGEGKLWEMEDCSWSDKDKL